MTDFLQNATDLINRGFSVIPIEPRGKRPLPGWGVLKRSRSLTDLAVTPADANVAICADENIVILETDDLSRLSSLVTLPITLMACGSSENRPHLFFKRTGNPNVRNMVVPGLFEARFENQYVVAPGSIHPCGVPYRWLNSSDICPIPDQLLLQLSQLSESSRQRLREVIKDGGEIPSGTRHDTRMHTLGTAWDGKKSFDEMMAIAQELNARSSPADDENKIATEVRYIMEECEPNVPAGKVGFTKVGEQGPSAVIDEEEMIYGLFPRGTVNILHGYSGVGKTRILFCLESAARDGKSFLGYSGASVNPLFILRDRQFSDYYRTFRKMGLPRDFVNLVELEPSYFDVDAVKKIEVFIEEYKRPPLVVVEGLDVMMTATNNRHIVVRVMSDLQKLVTHTGTAILGTWGAPKRQFVARDRYNNARAAAAGSGEVARMCNTMIKMEPIFERKKNGEQIKTKRIEVMIDLRDGAEQQHFFKFNQRGWLEEIDRLPVKLKTLDDLSYREMQQVMTSKTKFHDFKNQGA